MRAPVVGGGLVAQCQALVHAEAVLLVDHRQPQTPEFDPGLHQRVGADHQRGAGGDARQCLLTSAAGDASAEPHQLDAQRLEPRAQRAQVLLGQQLGGCGERGLATAGHGPCRGQGRNHGLAGADIALQQAQHGAFARQVGGDFPGRPGLGAGQLERQCRAQPLVQVGLGQRRRAQCIAALAELAGGEEVGGEFFQHQAPACRVVGRQQFGRVVVGGWPVQLFQGLGQPRQRRRPADACGQQVGESQLAAVHPVQGPPGKLAQRALVQPGYRRIDRGQMLCGFGRCGIRVATIFRVNHLVAPVTFAHLAESAQAGAGLETVALARVKMEKPKLDVAGAIAEDHRQRTAPAAGDSGVPDGALDQPSLPGLQAAYGQHARAILVAQRQAEEQIADTCDVQLRQLLRQLRPDAVKALDGRIGLLFYRPVHITPSISTGAPLGSSATPSAARAG